MGKHTEKAIRLLWGKYKALGSWAAVAVDIGLTEGDRAAVRKAAHGAVMVKVYRALKIPYKKEAQERARLGRIRGWIALSGKLYYTDREGREAVADLSERARRLGVTAEAIRARDLYSFITGRAVPALREKVKNG
jgi:hypothetical protein